MAKTTLTISSKNYSSWSLRGWLLTITRNCAMDAHRSARQTVAVEDPATLLAAPVAAHATTAALAARFVPPVYRLRFRGRAKSYPASDVAAYPHLP